MAGMNGGSGFTNKLVPHLRRAGLRLIAIALPCRCLRCGDMLEEQAGVCARCWSLLRFISSPYCHCCGLPFEFDPGSSVTCAVCVAYPPPVDRMRAALAYDDGIKPVILAFKHGDRLDAGPVLSQWMHRAGNDLLQQCDVIVPIPLHWGRLLRRRYNQAAILALRLGRLAHKPVETGVLLRRHATRSQGNLSRSARERNVAGAFGLKQSGRPVFEGKHVLLIDDVVTTGATAQACARILKQHGDAASVTLLSVARVLRPVTLG